MEETLKPVEREMMCATTIIPMAAIKPACPTIIGSRKYIITPKMVRIDGVKTPPKVPNLFDFAMSEENQILVITPVAPNKFNGKL